MPKPDLPKSRRFGRSFSSSLGHFAWLHSNNGRKRKSGKDKDRGGVPVEPDRPNSLSGGAAAALEFDE